MLPKAQKGAGGRGRPILPQETRSRSLRSLRQPFRSLCSFARTASWCHLRRMRSAVLRMLSADLTLPSSSQRRRSGYLPAARRCCCRTHPCRALRRLIFFRDQDGRFFSRGRPNRNPVRTAPRAYEASFNSLVARSQKAGCLAYMPTCPLQHALPASQLPPSRRWFAHLARFARYARA